MALTPCARCRQPFYAACHEEACIIGAALCPWCTYAEAATSDPPTPPAAPVSAFPNSTPDASAQGEVVR